MNVKNAALDVVGGFRLESFPCADVLDEVTSPAPAIDGFDFLDIKDAVRVHVAAESDFKVVVCRSVQLQVQFHITDVRPTRMDDDVRKNLRVRIRRYWLCRHVDWVGKSPNECCNYTQQWNNSFQ